MNLLQKIQNRVSPFFNFYAKVTVPTKAGKVKIWVNPSHGYVDRHLFWDNEYSPHITHALEVLVKPGMVVADIGANIGFFSVLMGKLGATVYAFEPSKRICDQLVKNVSENGMYKVIPERMALSNQKGVAVLVVPEKEFGQSSIENHAKGTSEVVTLDTLDSFMEDRDIERLDFIKLDVEGHEHSVLEGAVDTLVKYHPSVVHELSVELSPENALKQLNILSDLGYQHSVILRKGHELFPFDCSNEEYVERMKGKQRDILSVYMK